MGKVLTNLIKTAGAANAEAKEQYQELLKVGQVIGQGIAYELFEKEGAAMPKFLKSLGTKASELATKAKATKAGTKVTELAGKAKETAGKAKDTVEHKAQSLGSSIRRKTPGLKNLKSDKAKRVTNRALGLGVPLAAGTAVGGGAVALGKNFSKKKQAEAEPVKPEESGTEENGPEKTAETVPLSNFILRYQEKEGDQ